MIFVCGILITILICVYNKSTYLRYLDMIKYRESLFKQKEFVEKEYNQKMTYDDYNKVNWKESYELGKELDNINKNLRSANRFILRYEKSFTAKIEGTYQQKH